MYSLIVALATPINAPWTLFHSSHNCACAEPPPASDGGTPITGYTVTAQPGGATCATTGTTECKVTGLHNGTAYTFTKCAWWPNIVLDGSGTQIDEGAENVGLTLDLSVSGLHRGQITYRHNTTTDGMTLAGMFDGKAVTTPRPLP